MASTLNYLILLTFALTAVKEVCQVSGSRIITDKEPLEIRNNDLVMGRREPGDRLVHQEIVTKKPLLTGRKVVYLQTFYALRDYVITQVRALDLSDNGTGGSVTLKSGGPQLNNVTLRFKSNRFRGIHSLIQVFAKLKQ